MRILYIDFAIPYLLKDADYPVGGAAVETNATARALAGAGHTVGILSWAGAGKYVGHRDFPFELIDSYDPDRGIRIAKYIYSYLPSLVRAARGFRPDVLIQSVRGPQTGLMAIVGQLIGVPFIYRVASDADADARFTRGLNSIQRLAYKQGLRRAALFLCQNSYQFRALQSSHPHTPAVIIHNPIPLPRVKIAPSPRHERDYVAWLGNFRHEKNLPLLLTIARELDTTQFRIGGLPNPNMDLETRTAVEELRKLGNVKFLGHIPRANVTEFLSRSIGLLCTSRYEGFSNTFLEAFAVGTPVITWQGADPDNLVRDRVLGISATAASQLSLGVKELCSLPAPEFMEIAWRCQNYVYDNHSFDKKAGEIVDAIRKIL